jgi:hypothetical protein
LATYRFNTHFSEAEAFRKWDELIGHGFGIIFIKELFVDW